jgi:F-type H+-transporting ATPase subunit epsilon
MQVKDNIQLVVLTPERTVLDAMVSKVELPASKGRFVVLYNHAPVITSLDEGDVVYECDGKTVRLGILGGFAEVNDNSITICAEL